MELVCRRPFKLSKLQRPKRALHEEPVQSGLAITPSDIERLAQQGVAVSVPNADNFIYNNESGWEIDPVYARDADRNSMWEASQQAKHRIMRAKKRDEQRYT
ncbi:hypothetical protein [Chicken microvirus mg8_45]|nr:hypothetical protein [Chicken microvirus mg8_45]